MPIVKCYENNTIFYTYQSLPKFSQRPTMTVAVYGLPNVVSSRFDRWMRVLCFCDYCCDVMQCQ
jgi:hypothetical protein